MSARNQHWQPLHLSVITPTSGTEGPWWKLEEGGCGEEGRTKVTTCEFVVLSLEPANSLCISFRNPFKIEYLTRLFKFPNLLELSHTKGIFKQIISLSPGP